MGMSSPATCEFGHCGVAAIGRCRECRRAFCMTHRAYEPSTWLVDLPIVDQCRPCQERAKDRASDQATKALESSRERHLAEGKTYLPAFLKAMATRGNPGAVDAGELTIRDGRYEPSPDRIRAWPLVGMPQRNYFSTNGTLYRYKDFVPRSKGLSSWLRGTPSGPWLERETKVYWRMGITDGTLVTALKEIARGQKITIALVERDIGPARPVQRPGYRVYRRE